MVLRAFLFFSFLLIQVSLFGYGILENSYGEVLSEAPFFNSSFIQSHRIKSIKGYYSTKASMDIIRKTNQVYTYEFDNKGRLIREYLTKANDTVVTLYVYNSDSRIIYIMKSNHAGYVSEHYIYDDLGKVIEKQTKRETNKGKDKLNFIRDESYEISTEKFAYEPLENGNYKKLYYNKLGKIYKEELYFHAQKKIMKMEMRMIMGSARQKISYAYNKNGSLSEYTDESWIMGHKIIRYAFDYDEKGRVAAKYYYKNRKYITEYQIVYDETTGYLKSFLIRDNATDFITILHFKEYKFYF